MTAEDECQAGNRFYAAGNLAAALSHYRAALQLSPASARYHAAAGVVLIALGGLDDAERQLRHALALDTNERVAHEALGQLYSQLGRGAEALHHARRAVELAPDDLDAAISLALVLEADRQTEAAWDILQRALASGHETIRLATVFTRLAANLKREPEALALVGRLLASRRFRHARDEASLCFMASHLLDRLGRYDEAFAQAQRANALTGIRYDARQFEATVDALIAYFTPAKMRSLPRPPRAGGTPVFIVGMARSGSTLVEQILASHPAIFGAGELPQMFLVADLAAKRLCDPGSSMPACLDRLTPEIANELADAYLKPLEALAPAESLITDKQLANFQHLGLIALLFPNAKVIHCRRDPLDTCLSCFMTEFGAGYEFSFHLMSTGQHYRQYLRLMTHWRNVLDLKMLDVQYEDVVADQEGQSRRLLEFLGLEWNPAVLRFHDHPRMVATASNEQVRRPIYKSSVNRWRNYEKHLLPLRNVLEA